MIRRSIAIVLMTLSATCVLPSVRAATGDDEQSVQLYGKAEATPFGSVDGFGTVAINGRLARGAEVVWGGELLEATSPAGARVSLPGLGRVALAQGARVRLAAAEGRWLVASLLDGRISIRLDRGSAAYLEVCGRFYTTSRGAALHVGVRAGDAEVAITQGQAQSGGATPQSNTIFKLRPVGLGASESVKARSRRTVQVQVTDEHDRKIPDAPVVFALTEAKGGALSVGQLSGASVTTTTNAQGIATATFEAASEPASTNITASIPGSKTEPITVTTIKVTAAGLSTAAIVTILVVVGGATGGTIAILKSGNSNDGNIMATGQPSITP